MTHDDGFFPVPDTGIVPATFALTQHDRTRPPRPRRRLGLVAGSVALLLGIGAGAFTLGQAATVEHDDEAGTAVTGPPAAGPAQPAPVEHEGAEQEAD